MNVPALAAFAPEGPTHTIVGIVASARDASMRCIELLAAAQRVELEDHGRGAIRLGLVNRPAT